MAEWCKQCSDGMFGEDRPDYPTFDEVAKPGYGYDCLCEGCGPTAVNEKGECIYPSCSKHGDNPEPELSDELPQFFKD